METTSRQSHRIPAERLGFTLVELLVVITIIGILAALITVAAMAALRTARQTQIKAEITEISNGFEESKNKTTAYPPNCQTDGTGGPLEDIQILNDLRRYMKQAFPRHREPPELIARLAGLTPAGTPLPSNQALQGGMTAAEAIPFWLGGFSSDPKYPISGEGGPAYPIQSLNDPDNRTLDPIENRPWIYPVEVTRLGPRDSGNYFDTAGRAIEYTVAINGVNQFRRINFWQYAPRKSTQPYVYFDTSRHPAGVLSGSTLLGHFDPPAATDLTGTPLHVHPIKKVNPTYSTATASSVPAVVFVDPEKFQVMHCGLDDDWAVSEFEKMSVHDVGTNDPTAYLLFPAGPFMGEVADTIVNFTTETRLEDSVP